jgi:prepilin-type N-terminal cleavage/methylation domain-containing protein
LLLSRETAVHRRPPFRQGFTLIEAVIVVGIISLTAAMAGTAMIYGTGRAALNNAAFEISALVSIAQMRAANTGRPHYIAFLPNDIVLVDDATKFDTTFDATKPAEMGGTVVERVRLNAPIGYVPISFTGTRLPQPFSTVPIAASGSAGLLVACSNCISGTNGARAVLRVGSDGMVAMETGKSVSAPGIAISIGSIKTGEVDRRKLLVISTPMGAVKLF